MAWLRILSRGLRNFVAPEFVDIAPVPKKFVGGLH